MAFKEPVLSPKGIQKAIATDTLNNLIKEHRMNKPPPSVFNNIIDKAMNQKGPGTIQQKVKSQFRKILVPSKKSQQYSSNVVKDRYAKGHLRQ